MSLVKELLNASKYIVSHQEILRDPRIRVTALRMTDAKVGKGRKFETRTGKIKL
jgi:hypothetical protein